MIHANCMCTIMTPLIAVLIKGERERERERQICFSQIWKVECGIEFQENNLHTAWIVVRVEWKRNSETLKRRVGIPDSEEGTGGSVMLWLLSHQNAPTTHCTGTVPATSPSRSHLRIPEYIAISTLGQTYSGAAFLSLPTPAIWFGALPTRDCLLFHVRSVSPLPQYNTTALDPNGLKQIKVDTDNFSLILIKGRRIIASYHWVPQPIHFDRHWCVCLCVLWKWNLMPQC